MTALTVGRAGRFKDAAAPFAGVGLLLTLWFLATTLLDIRTYLLPPPGDVLASLWRGVTAPIGSRASMLYHLGVSLQAAGIGLALGTVLGVAVGSFAAASRVVDGALSPYVFAMQGLPKIAMAPIMMIWFGFGLTTKALLAAFLVFFPMFVNTYTGLTNVDRDLERLFRSLRANKRQTLLKLRIPSATVMIFAGLEIAVVQALLGAIVGEFIAANSGIGILLLQYQTVANTPAMFAALILLAITGVVLHGVMRLIRKRALYWSPDVDAAGDPDA